MQISEHIDCANNKGEKNSNLVETYSAEFANNKCKNKDTEQEKSVLLQELINKMTRSDMKQAICKLTEKLTWRQNVDIIVVDMELVIEDIEIVGYKKLKTVNPENKLLFTDNIFEEKKNSNINTILFAEKYIKQFDKSILNEILKTLYISNR